METALNLTEEERINAFARELGIALRRILDVDNVHPPVPIDLPVPFTKSNSTKGDD